MEVSGSVLQPWTSMATPCLQPRAWNPLWMVMWVQLAWGWAAWQISESGIHVISSSCVFIIIQCLLSSHMQSSHTCVIFTKNYVSFFFQIRVQWVHGCRRVWKDRNNAPFMMQIKYQVIMEHKGVRPHPPSITLLESLHFGRWGCKSINIGGMTRPPGTL